MVFAMSGRSGLISGLINDPQEHTDKMRNVLRGALACTILLIGTASPARASVLFYFNAPGAVNPSENLLFNAGGLILTGTTVQGLTQTSSTLVDITGQESLVAGGGQARVTGQDGGFTWLRLQPNQNGTMFSEFEANLIVHKAGKKARGVVTVQITDKLGSILSGSYDVGNGQNFFSFSAVAPDLIQSVLITSTMELKDIRQIRLGGLVTAQEITPVPEPASMVLFGTGLFAVGRRFRRRRAV
jgi:hypothetical protein